MKAALIVLAVAAVVGFVVWVAVLAKREEAALDEVWKEFARERGYRWREASGAWHSRQLASVRGERDGVSFVLDRYVVSNGKTSTTYTRVRATLAEPARERLSIRRNTWWQRSVNLFRAPLVGAGDARFDGLWLVRSKNAGEVRRLVDARARAAVLSLTVPADVDIAGSEVKVVWHASEKRVGVLDGAIEVAVALAGARRVGARA